MQHVIAFDVSMGKSYMVIYNAQNNVFLKVKSIILSLILKNYENE